MGEFPYKNCQSDFEVLTKVLHDEQPRLPVCKGFSMDFVNFVDLWYARGSLRWFLSGCCCAAFVWLLSFCFVGDVVVVVLCDFCSVVWLLWCCAVVVVLCDCCGVVWFL